MLTAKKALRITRELWTCIAKNPDVYTKEDDKYNWPGWEKYGYMSCQCPLCQYRNEKQSGCFDCLVNWGGRFNVCYVKNVLFRKWRDARKPETRSKYAWGIVKLVKQAEERLKKGGN